MIDTLRHHITKRLGNEPENLEDVLSFFKEIRVKRGALLLEKGRNCDHVYYIASGCKISYILSHS